MGSNGDAYPRIVMSGTDPDLPDQIPTGYEKYSDFQEMAKGVKAALHACWDGVMGRTVAMKTLIAPYADDKRERRRFLREARVTAQLQHPNTVPVYEIGSTDKGGLYFTMKRIAGSNFFQVLQRMSWSKDDSRNPEYLDRHLEIIMQICDALSYAHLHGVVHRDLKPENIWIGDFGEVVLLDWGVAKVWGQALHEHHSDPVDQDDDAADRDWSKLASTESQLQTLTMTGNRPGTPLYMSPEQVMGKPSLDERTDIFSMGVLIHEMLSLTEPFRGRTIGDTFDNILYSTPKIPSEARPDRGIPESLDNVVIKALAKKPEERYQNMREMLEDLELARRDLVRSMD